MPVALKCEICIIQSTVSADLDNGDLVESINLRRSSSIIKVMPCSPFRAWAYLTLRGNTHLDGGDGRLDLLHHPPAGPTVPRVLDGVLCFSTYSGSK